MFEKRKEMFMKTKKLFSIMLAVLMLISAASVSAFAESKQIYSVSVSFSVSDGDDSIVMHTLNVSSDIAEKYDYKTAEKDHNGENVESVTVFDVIVAEHEAIYGDSFLKNPERYLVMSSGFIMKAFEKNAAASSFIVNNVMPNDGIVNPAYGSSTGYACDTAPVADGDTITYFFFKDLTGYSDYYSWFDSENYTVNAKDTLKVNLKGYCAMYYGLNKWQTILDEYAENLDGVDVYAMVDNKKVLLGTTDKDGNANLTFLNEGDYLIFAEGETKGGSPVILSYATVTVNPQETQSNSFFEWLKETWSTIKSWFIKAFDFLFGWIFR